MVPHHGPKTCSILTSSSPTHPGDASIPEPLMRGPALSQHFILGLQIHPHTTAKIKLPNPGCPWPTGDVPPPPQQSIHPPLPTNKAPHGGMSGAAQSPAPPNIAHPSHPPRSAGKILGIARSRRVVGRGGGGDVLTGHPARRCRHDGWSRCRSQALRISCLVPPWQQPVISEATFPARTPQVMRREGRNEGRAE